MSPIAGCRTAAGRCCTSGQGWRPRGWPLGSVDSVADVLSVHFYEGGDLDRAWRYAGCGRLARAQAAHANTDAAALFPASPRGGPTSPRDRCRRDPDHLILPARRRAGAGRPARRGDGGVSAGHGPRGRRPGRAGPPPAAPGPVPASARVGSSLRCVSSAQPSEPSRASPATTPLAVRVAVATMRAIIRQGQAAPAEP